MEKSYSRTLSANLAFDSLVAQGTSRLLSMILYPDRENFCAQVSGHFQDKLAMTINT